MRSLVKPHGNLGANSRIGLVSVACECRLASSGTSKSISSSTATKISLQVKDRGCNAIQSQTSIELCSECKRGRGESILGNGCTPSGLPPMGCPSIKWPTSGPSTSSVRFACITVPLSNAPKLFVIRGSCPFLRELRLAIPCIRDFRPRSSNDHPMLWIGGLHSSA
jgi:hypothetical protein